MGHRKYFHTWSNQNNPKVIELKDTFEWGYTTPSDDKIFDLSSGSYHQSFGLKNKQLIDALIHQLNEIPMAIPKTEFTLKTEVSQKLVDRIGFDGRIFYTLSGAESNENALKIVRQFTKREIILSCENSYHGATSGSLALSGDWRRDALGTSAPGQAFIPNFYNDPDLEITKKIIKDIGADNIAAICLETITGGNGVYIPPVSYYIELEKVCRTNDIKIILDEVICGFGRTGKDFGFQNYPIKPDFITFAKSISGGYFPFGATFVSEDIASFFDSEVLSCGLTNASHPIGLRLLDEVLNLTKDANFQNTLKENINLLSHFKDKLIKLDSVSEVRSIGMLMAIELNTNEDMRVFWENCLNNGLYINTTRNMIILCPYLNYPNDLLEDCLEKLLNIIQNK
ncbi:aminotransferase class III-fold pyridoxal phosphate-dependent enzyme [Halobacteriovorax sp.]|uniref:aminotransferase class III-fold pyridoxal phosphate-dependent enzyme n=1 Tax=Halobacteriovorax sp. TaxID=2020862 RepID=UPI003AF2D136